MMAQSKNDSTTRFSNRVENYVRYRPGYPASVVHLLKQLNSLDTSKTIVDIGAGTGISSEIFLKEGYSVIAVEPNKEMRDKSVELLGNFPGFAAIDGTAESPNLPDHSADVIVCAQAFHWFDKEKTRPAFKRLLKKGGILVLIWNERLTSSDFEQEYDKLIVKHARDYAEVNHRNISEGDVRNFYSPQACQLITISNEQAFDFEGLKGRLLSSSYMPVESDSSFVNLIFDLRELFDRFNKNGKITIHYETKVYTGPL